MLAGTSNVCTRRNPATFITTKPESKGEFPKRWERVWVGKEAQRGSRWKVPWYSKIHYLYLQGKLSGRGQELSEPLPWPHGGVNLLPAGQVKWNQRQKSSPLADILGSSQKGEFLKSNPSTNEELKHIVPIRKEMQIRKSGICVHDNRGNVFWQIWVHLYSNKYFSLWLWHFFAWDISEPYWMLLPC